MHLQKTLTVFALLFLIACTGCAEGPFWRLGGYVPWVRAKWAAEEQIAETVHSKKAKLRNLAKRASRLSAAEKERAVNDLATFIRNEKIIQLRVDAAYALGQINNQAAEEALVESLKDAEAEVRIAAVNALTLRKTETAGKELIRVVGSDTDKDVRSAAIRGLANYPSEATVQALARVLDEPEPALQYVAMKSLDDVTGADIGINVTRWKERLAQQLNRDPQNTNRF